MKVLFWVFFTAGICFCAAGIRGHIAGWAAAALSFFAATMIMVGQRDNKKK